MVVLLLYILVFRIKNVSNKELELIQVCKHNGYAVLPLSFYPYLIIYDTALQCLHKIN